MKNFNLILDCINTIDDNNSLIVKGAIKDINRNIRTFSYATEKTQINLKRNILKSLLYLVIHVKQHNIRKLLFEYVADNMECNKTSNWYKCIKYYKGICFLYKKEKSFNKYILYINDVPFSEVQSYDEAKKKTKNLLLDISI